MAFLTAVNPDQGINLVLPLVYAIMCIVAGREGGYKVDLQYRRPEGKPRFISIPDGWKWLFHFHWFFGTEVVKEGLLLQVLGYAFAGLEILLFAFSRVSGFWTSGEIAGLALLVLFADTGISSLGVLLPMAIRYEHNLQKVYYCDWITHLQEALTLYPKRRCRILSQIDDSTYRIQLGGILGKKYEAKSWEKYSVGENVYAVHSYEMGYPFWKIQRH